jgi:hypothetical protein
MSKFSKITGHCYIVENQNGFNNALYDYFKDYEKERVRKMVQNYPEHYPTTIIIIDQSFECNRVYIECFDIKEISHQHHGFCF